MGGRGSGGLRVGAGRKSKRASEHWLGGHAGKRTKGAKRPAVEPALPPLSPPSDFTPQQRAVWERLAPQACAARTLTEQTVEAFALLCRQIVLERLMFAQIEADGLTCDKVTLQMDEHGGGLQSVEKKAHTLLPRLQGMMQRVETGLSKFRLSAMGKELAPAERPKDEWDDFEDTAVN